MDTIHADLEQRGFPGVRATLGFAMRAISDGCTSVELSNRLGVSTQAVTRTAQALETMGFVTRITSDADRRERLLTPTDHGRRMLDISAESFWVKLHKQRERAGDAALDTTLRTLKSARPAGADRPRLPTEPIRALSL